MTTVRSFRYAVAVALAVAALAACASFSAPLKAAQTAAQRAYALEKEYNIVLEDASAIVRDPTTDAVVRTAIQKAVATNSKVIDQLDAAAGAAAIERAKFDAGMSSVDKLEVVANNIDKWYPQAAAAIASLRSAFH